MKTSRLLLLSMLGIMLVSRGLVNAQDNYDEDNDTFGGGPPAPTPPDIPYFGSDDPTTEPSVPANSNADPESTVDPFNSPADPTDPADSDATTPDDQQNVVPDMTDESTTEAVNVEETTTEDDIGNDTTDPADADVTPDDQQNLPTEEPTDAPLIQNGDESSTEEPDTEPPLTEEPTDAPLVQNGDAEESTTEDSRPTIPSAGAVPDDQNADNSTPAQDELTTEDSSDPDATTTYDPNSGDGKVKISGDPGDGDGLSTSTEDSGFVTIPDDKDTTTYDPNSGNGQGGTSGVSGTGNPIVTPSPRRTANGGYFDVGAPVDWTVVTIDPVVKSNIPDTNQAYGRAPGVLTNGQRLSEMKDGQVERNDFAGGAFPQMEVNSKEGQYVLSAVQTKGEDVIFDPYTIGQVLGYLYEWQEFNGIEPPSGWTIKLFGGEEPRMFKRKKRSVKTRRASLIFKKKAEVIAKEEQDYWKQVMSSV